MNSYFNDLILLLKKLGIAFLIFSLCRISFYIFNTSHFNDISIDLFFYGLKFDLVAISYLFAPLIFLHLVPFSIRSIKWYQKLLTIFFYIGILTGVTLNMIDVGFFDFTLKRTTTDFFGMIATGDDFLKLLPNYIIDFWYLYILLAGLIFTSHFLHKKYCSLNIAQSNYKLKDYIIHIIILISFSGLTTIGMRGGIQYRPLDMVNAAQYAKTQNIPIILNTPFTIIKTILRDNLETVNYFTEENIDLVYTPKKTIQRKGNYQGNNVVLIILESFAKEYVGGFNDGKGYTPFIDSLLTKSYVFTNAYSNGGRSIEALPPILAGLPQLMTTPYVLSNYAGNQLNGISQELKKEGYNTSFYHSGKNGTMRFNDFAKIIGIDNYFGLNEYQKKDKDYDGAWGIFDEPYLQYFAKELNKKEEPFFSTIFTISSHHPYSIPKEHSGKFPKGNLPLHETVGYTDYALKHFFKTAKEMPWFKNTIFVFTADHSARSNALKYKTRLGRYAIPFFIYSASGNLKGNSSEIFQHIDITPTILSLVSEKNKIISFGNNAFDDSQKFAVQFINNTYQITVKNNFLIFDGSNTINFYDLSKDSLLTNNLINSLDPQQENEKNRIEKLLKGIIQQYNNRLINNSLTFKKE